MLDVHWFSGPMLCICSLCHFVCDSPKHKEINQSEFFMEKKKIKVVDFLMPYIPQQMTAFS